MHWNCIVTDIDGGLLLVTGQNPNFNVGIQQTSNRLGYTLKNIAHHKLYNNDFNKELENLKKLSRLSTE